jgi:hypothetical protein
MEKMPIIMNIQTIQRELTGMNDDAVKLLKHTMNELNELQYQLIEKWNEAIKIKKMRLVIDKESVGIYIGPDELVRWDLDEVKEDETIALVMAKAVELFYTNPKKLL